MASQGSNNFSAQFNKLISHYKKICYNINVLQQTVCLVVNPITVGNFAFLRGGLDLRFYDGSDLKTFLKMRGLGPDVVSVVEPTRV